MSSIRLATERLSYADIRKRATSFLRDHGGVDSLPVDIEKIVDVGLGVDIVPMVDLLDELKGECCLASDLSTIWIDSAIYHHPIPHRCRSTLAHEVGHVVLHKEIFEGLALDTPEDWVDFHTNVHEDDYYWLETQARIFAGCLLAPEAQLRVHFERILEEFGDRVKRAKEEGLSQANYREYLSDMIANRLKPIFLTSSQLLLKRIEKDGLANLIP